MYVWSFQPPPHRHRPCGEAFQHHSRTLTAFDGPLRREYFPVASLDEDANGLVFPDLSASSP